ncbi:GNAT family N-acetyltransferase [Kitasatospora sp. NPDC050543]|uniref:GNAT family N-acetyltransferase n=1 Tax=Kitasatospora sp. NPDC050543 TaxID=3364054 RepID=UPI0037BAE545
MTVPFVPTLGPVHPDGLGPEVFADVIRVAGTGRFLPYDKDRRWSDDKDETVLALDIVHRPGQTLLPTLTRRGAGAVKVHVYGEPGLPQYFGVLPGYRGRGYGRRLWRAAMHWGQTHDAVYQLLQTEVAGPSDALCRSEGLTDLGLVHTATL